MNLKRIYVNLKNIGFIIALFALNVLADEQVSEIAISTDLKSRTTWVEVDNGTPMNVNEFNQRTDSKEKSTFCHKGECDALPRLVEGSAPEYPIKLLREEITGQVVITFTIDVNGHVVHPEIVSATRPEFAKSVITAISVWEFRPASLRGKPVEMRVQQTFPFELR
jgi:TonB family protein